MRPHYLLDTHAFIWAYSGSERLSPAALNIIQNPDFKKTLSIASIWEISIKINNKKIQFADPFKTVISETYAEFNISIIGLSLKALEQVEILPQPDPNHKDPFDRMIISQALVRKAPVISIDEKFDLYDIKRVW
jgi:PIN domain nuclease of toxin-antitoxin system